MTKSVELPGAPSSSIFTWRRWEFGSGIDSVYRTWVMGPYCKDGGRDAQGSRVLDRTPAGAYNMNMFIIRWMLKMLLVLVASEGHALALGTAYSFALVAIFATPENPWDAQRNQAETLGIMLPAAG